MKANLSKETRLNLIHSWGNEIILRCCRDWPSHDMLYQKGPGRCGICKNIPVVIEASWDEMEDFDVE